MPPPSRIRASPQPTIVPESEPVKARVFGVVVVVVAGTVVVTAGAVVVTAGTAVVVVTAAVVVTAGAVVVVVT
jgi:hypothetical protein